MGGRYLDQNTPSGGRLTLYPDFVTRYRSKPVEMILKQYKVLAENLTQLSHAFVYSRSFLTSCIIGPSNIEQLEETVGALSIELSKELLAEIERIHEGCPSPCA